MRNYTRVVQSITLCDGIQSNGKIIIINHKEIRCVGFFSLPFELIAMPSMNKSVDVTDSESESLP